MKAIIIARVSTEEQKLLGSSLPAQLFRLERYCEQKRYEIINTFSFDETAYTTKRNEFDAIMKVINGTKEKVAVCFDKVDRLSRNIFDKRVAVLYDKALADEVELHFVSDGQVINTQMSAAEKFGFGIKLGLAKYYSDAISDNVRRVFELKRKNGEWTGGVRLGYLNVSRDDERRLRKDIILDESRAHFIINIFDWYASGNYSLETIRRDITALGLRNRKGQPLPKSSISNILRDSFYCGLANSRTYGFFEHKYPRLISKEVFDECEAIRLKRYSIISKFASQDFSLKGILTCKRCGCTITPEVKRKSNGKNYIYYSCTNSKRICQREYIREEYLLEGMYRSLDQLKNISPEIICHVIQQLDTENIEYRKVQKIKLTAIKAELETLRKKQNSLLDFYLEKNIDSQTYNGKNAELEANIKKLCLDESQLAKVTLNEKNSAESVFRMLPRIVEIAKSSEPAEKRQILNWLFQNSTLEGKKPYYIMVSPFPTVVHWDHFHTKLPSLDELRKIDWNQLKRDIEKHIPTKLLLN